MGNSYEEDDRFKDLLGSSGSTGEELETEGFATFGNFRRDDTTLSD